MSSTGDLHTGGSNRGDTKPRQHTSRVLFQRSSHGDIIPVEHHGASSSVQRVIHVHQECRVDGDALHWHHKDTLRFGWQFIELEHCFHPGHNLPVHMHTSDSHSGRQILRFVLFTARVNAVLCWG